MFDKFELDIIEIYKDILKKKKFRIIINNW